MYILGFIFIVIAGILVWQSMKKTKNRYVFSNKNSLFIFDFIQLEDIKKFIKKDKTSFLSLSLGIKITYDEILCILDGGIMNAFSVEISLIFFKFTAYIFKEWYHGQEDIT